MATETFLGRAKRWARRIKRDVVALWIAARDPHVPWYAKALCAAIAAYALSPIDLIPDFIPVLGYLDDVILLPLGILLAVRLIPPDLMAEFRAEANARAERPVSRVAAAVIIGLWIGSAALLLWAFWSRAAADGPGEF
ncbi:YkvA family protein [Aurantimonas marina]|uniref:YkvA family protein n=1 Tax=Aurantimonas marina TaxID=2780508 RepID=UPI0019CF5988|nr:YkvA family protein [Aurantimonas marina]